MMAEVQHTERRAEQTDTRYVDSTDVERETDHNQCRAPYRFGHGHRRCGRSWNHHIDHILLDHD